MQRAAPSALIDMAGRVRLTSHLLNSGVFLDGKVLAVLDGLNVCVVGALADAVLDLVVCHVEACGEAMTVSVRGAR